MVQIITAFSSTVRGWNWHCKAIKIPQQNTLAEADLFLYVSLPYEKLRKAYQALILRMPSSLQSTYKLPIMRPACGGNRLGIEREQRNGQPETLVFVLTCCVVCISDVDILFIAFVYRWRTQRAGKETDIKSHWIMAWPAWVSFKHASKIHANRIPTPEGLTHLSR
ncbi:hypothetical protein QQP08_008289 [Theobroma cacao]|nr:hypothetical protein QQP08_008289 [Theobroma cacao]